MTLVGHARVMAIRAIVLGLVLVPPAGFVVWGGGDRPLDWDFRTALSGLLIVAVIASTIAGLVGLARPGLVLSLQGLGRYGDPLTVSEAIDAEQTDPSERLEFGSRLRTFGIVSSPYAPIVLTASWLTQMNPMSLQVVSLKQVVRCYKKVVTINGIESDYFLVVQEMNGRTVDFGQTSDVVDKAIDAMRKVIPHAIYGA